MRVFISLFILFGIFDILGNSLVGAVMFFMACSVIVRVVAFVTEAHRWSESQRVPRNWHERRPVRREWNEQYAARRERDN